PVLSPLFPYTTLFRSLKLRVKSIEPSRVADSACIAVDHPEKLYVVQDFIVTHNTFVAILCMLRLKLRTVYIFKGGYADRWVGDLDRKSTRLNSSHVKI